MLLHYKEKGFDSPIVKTVCEVYEVSDNRKMTRVKEVTLYKSSSEYYRGSKKEYDNGGHLSRGSIACNDSLLIWWTPRNFHVFNFQNGIRIKKEDLAGSNYITFYDPKDKYYYAMDAACYSWLQRAKAPWFKL